MHRLDHVCRSGRSDSRAGARAAASEALYAEQETPNHPVNTFTNYHNASGMGPQIAAGQWVEVSCKIFDSTIASVNPDGYWYRIASSPWNDSYYSPANTFMNGDPYGGPYTHNTDFNVPDCGSTPAPPAGVAVLAQGAAAPSGYRYAVTVEHFAANSSVSVSCRDSVSPSGFYTFSLPTDASGHGFSESFCYSADGPEHWVVVDGTVESNHVPWAGGGAPPGGATGGGASGSPGAGSSSGGGGTGSKPSPQQDTCVQFHGSRIADSGIVAASLFGHYLTGHGEEVVIDWSFFSGNSSFVQEAKSLKIGEFVIGWEAPHNTDMYAALGHFMIERDTADCYLVYDHYDFDWRSVKEYLAFFPFWAVQILGAREFDEHASGKL